MTSPFDKFSSRTLSVSSSVIPVLMGEPALVAVSMIGTEGVDSLFDYQVILKTPDALNHLISQTADFKTQEWLGQEMSVQIQLEGSGSFVAGQMGMSGMGNVGAGVREINGIIDDARFLRVEGRYAFYEVRLKPWLAMATLITDCTIFQDKTVKEVIDESLSGLNYSIEWRLIDTYPKRDYTTQFNESTFHFVSRLCETWGISYFFEHSEGKHRLIFTDYMGGYRPNASEAYQTVLFHTPNAKIDEEYIHAFVPANKLASGIFTTRDFDYTRPRADLTVTQEDPIKDAGHNQHEVYEWHKPSSGHSHYVQPKAGPNQATNVPLDEGQFLARIRMEQLHCKAYRAYGSGHLKGMQPGHSFKLSGHPRNTANIDYLILSTKLTIREVAQETQSPGNPNAQRHEVEVDFDVYPLRGAGGYRPASKTPVPKMYGVESAIVVGPENQDLWTDDLGRIKIQFHWDRLGKNDQNSCCWVRVSSPWAGNQLGGVHIPRMGQEVLIGFISGNPDLPICTGRVHNQSNLPPWQLPSQQALSGFRSRELTPGGGNAAGGRSNHLVMDDSEGKIQAQLKSDHLHSQLSLGYITRIEDNQGRKDPRGEGFSLETEGAGAIRSSKGLLLSTDGRAKAIGGTLSRDELVVCLEHALAIAKDLGKAAVDCQGGQRDLQPQRDLSQAVDAMGHGTNDEVDAKGKAIGGQAIIAISGAAGIASATPKDHTQYAGQNIDTIAERNQQHYAEQSIMHSAGQDIEQYARHGEVRTIANQGKIIQQAQNNNIELTAEKLFTVTSTKDGIVLHAKSNITLALADGTYMKLEGGGVTFGMSGQFVVKSGGRSFVGPAGVAIDMPQFNRVDLAQQLQTHYTGNRGLNAPVHDYEITHAAGNIVSNKTGNDALSALAKKKPFGIFRQ
ncbi:type VI secretion system Vgr family protein [Collimonas humicola]|uniref:type VI secretion system Vgr family protein n=1 Tax=Collimonas humicola TaxID=2825886 RepID=UPI001B8CB0BD|nr:type VI secretion system Vgr family protein [Collimonas humicola]